MPSTINAIPDPITGVLRKSGAADANLVLQTNSANALSINNLQNPTCNSTGSIKIPSGTTAQRPSPAVNGMIRYNTTIPSIEGYANNTWVTFL